MYLYICFTYIFYIYIFLCMYFAYVECVYVSAYAFCACVLRTRFFTHAFFCACVLRTQNAHAFSCARVFLRTRFCACELCVSFVAIPPTEFEKCC